jgi:hypothetical protein
MYGIRQIAGALLHDAPIYFRYMLPFTKNGITPSWVFVRNRNEELISEQMFPGVKCKWKWTSDLYLPKVFPAFGHWLYRRAFQDFPVHMKEKAALTEKAKPDVSFIIGHRGMERLPLLLATLKSIAGQQGCSFECIVVEHDDAKLIMNQLPLWVKYVHSPLHKNDIAYSRSMAFNEGAKAAKSELLVFHDNDLLVPARYADNLLKYFRDGYEVINLKRFIFYLDKISTKQVCDQASIQISPGIEAIMQNAEGGGSICITNEAFLGIGGFDERFVGWGGEDNEFWERAATRRVYPYGYLPLVHLWHAPQAGKQQRSQAEGVSLYRQLSAQSPEKRIQKLRSSQ